MIWDVWWIVAQIFFVRVYGPIFTAITEVAKAGVVEAAKGVDWSWVMIIVIGGWLLAFALAVAMIVLVLRALERFGRAPA